MAGRGVLNRSHSRNTNTQVANSECRTHVFCESSAFFMRFKGIAPMAVFQLDTARLLQDYCRSFQ